jgi:heme A synthase
VKSERSNRKEGYSMKKKLFAIVLVLTLVSLFAIVPAEAGSKTRYRWEGAGIALGALLLGGLVAHTMAIHASPPQVVYAPPPELRYYPPEPEWVPGHWEMTREWVPGTWERVWIPGHYDGRGHWVAGHTINRQTPGYYEERRVWIEGYYRQR